MSNSRGILLGAVLGGALAATTAIFLTSKKGRRLQRDVLNRCESCKEKIEDVVEEVQEKVKSFRGDINDSASGLSKKASDVLDFVGDEVSFLTDPKNEKLRKKFLIGGLCGSLIGAGAALLLTTTLSRQDEGKIARKIGSQMADWKTIIKEVLAATEKVEPLFKENHSDASRPKEVINEVIDLALVGVKLWNHLKKAH